MTVQFGNNRLAFYVFVFLLSGTVLGINGNFASQFSAGFKDGFIIFALVVTALQIFIFLLTLQWSQPWIELLAYFVFGVLWLAMGAWSTDLIGNVQCSELSGNMETKSGGQFSNKSFCRQMKVVQALSWTVFGLIVLAFIILNMLISQAKKFGRYHISKEPIRELGWFDEAPGYYNQHTAGQYPAYPGYGGYPASPGMMPMSAGAPGHSVIIQPGLNGAPPTITQVPMGA